MRLLQLLVYTEKLGSVSQAAQQIRMAQPNASTLLSRFERQLGTPLLNRSATGSTLTEAGAALAQWSQPVLTDLELWQTGASALRHRASTQLSVAASQTIADHLVPLWLAQFNSRYPTIDVTLTVANSAQVIDLVRGQQVTLGFIETPHVPADLHHTTVMTDQLGLVVTPTHPWVRRTRALPLTTLAKTPLVYREPGSGTRLTYETAMRDYRLARPACEVNSNTRVIAEVLATDTPAMISLLASAGLVRSGQLVRIRCAQAQRFRREFRALWLGSDQLVGTARDFVAIARAMTPSLQPST